MRKIVIGSRGSELALWQANHIKTQLEALKVDVEIRIIKTQGDNLFNLSIHKLEGKGFFTKELEDELLKGTIDLAVHSYKDLPTQSPSSLFIAAVSEREEPSDILLIHPSSVDIKETFSLVRNATVGTSSPRRKSQLKSHRPDLKLEDLRGNVPTRVQKVRDGVFDAILLAKAGINRLALDLTGIHVENLSTTEIIPAAAQGVLALQIREGDEQLQDKLRQLNHADVAGQIAVEREILTLFSGGCSAPLGIYCTMEQDEYLVWCCKAKTVDSFPDRLFLRSKERKGLPARVVEHFNKDKKQIFSVFITREVNQEGYLNKYLTQKGVKLEGISLIRTFPMILKMDSSILSRVDWIFFNSKNAVEYFLNLKPRISGDTKIGVVGRGSESALRDYGFEADFVGEASDTSMVARKFASMTENKTILFPQAKDSLRSIQNGLHPSARAIDLPVYETDIDENAQIPGADIIIFTSPSNVISYVQRSLIELDQKVIAIGKSTGAKLEEYGYTKYTTPWSPDELGLAEAIFSLM